MRAVILDRDGTIIVDKDYLTDPKQIEFLPGAVSALRRLKEAGFLLVVCTNQSAIARGLMTEQQYGEIEKVFLDMLKEHGVEIDASYYCPHLKEGTVERYAVACECRKPRMGMFLKARADLDFNPFSSYAVGDSLRDLVPGYQMGMKTVLVRTGKGEQSAKVELVHRFVTCVCADLSEAAEWIISDSRRSG